jgi:hypothetical protein
MALQSSGSSSDRIQTGTTAQRPSIAEPGQVRFNTTTSDFEVSDGANWYGMRPPVESPIKDTSRTLGLATGSGLELDVDGGLNAALGRGLYFDSSGKITLANTLNPTTGDPAVFFPPRIVSGRGSQTISFRQGGSGPQTYSDVDGLNISGSDSSDPGSVSPVAFEVSVPNECNLIVVETRSRYISRPNPNVMYGDGSTGQAYAGKTEADMGFSITSPVDGAQVVSGSSSGRNQAINTLGGTHFAVNTSDGKGDATYSTVFSQNRHDLIAINPIANPGTRILRLNSIVTRILASSARLDFQNHRFLLQPLFVSDSSKMYVEYP